MAFTIATFNANNLFVRYKFFSKYPGDRSGISLTAEPTWGYLPNYKTGLFEMYNPQQRSLTANVIKDTPDVPDILCLQEVESLIAIRLFNTDYLQNEYPYRFLVDSRDFRQIDVAVLSKIPLLSARSHVDDVLEDGEFGGEYTFKRDLLEVTVQPDGLDGPLTLFLCHLKSKYAESQEDEEKANRRRQVEAEAIARIVRERFRGDSFNEKYFAVLGDFNDTPDSPFLRPLVRDLGLTDTISTRIDAAEDRWTYYWKWKSRVEQIDYILVSPALDAKSGGHVPVIERRGLGFKNRSTVDRDTLPKQVTLASHAPSDSWSKVDFRFERFEGVSDDVAASDHCLVSLRLV